MIKSIYLPNHLTPVSPKGKLVGYQFSLESVQGWWSLFKRKTFSTFALVFFKLCTFENLSPKKNSNEMSARCDVFTSQYLSMGMINVRR